MKVLSKHIAPAIGIGVAIGGGSMVTMDSPLTGLITGVAISIAMAFAFARADEKKKTDKTE